MSMPKSCRLIGLLTCFYMLSTAAFAQVPGAGDEIPNGAVAAPERVASEATGPLIWVADAYGKLATVDSVNGSVKVKGAMGVVMTDIAFAPSGKLYGVSFTDFYLINPKTAKVKKIGRLGPTGINALFCPLVNNCLAHSFSQAQLYRINPVTGAATPVGSTSPFYSAGDLVKARGAFYLASTDRRLVRLNPATGAVLGSVSHGLTNLYGLASIGAGKDFGFAGTGFYRLNLANGASKLVRNLAGTGLVSIYGATFKGQF